MLPDEELLSVPPVPLVPLLMPPVDPPVLEPVAPLEPLLPPVALPLVSLLPLLPEGDGVVSGEALGAAELPPALLPLAAPLLPLSAPLVPPVALLPLPPALPVAPGASPLLEPEAGGVLGVELGLAVVPEVLELPVVSGVPASFLPHPASARVATMAASKTEYFFMSIPLKKIYLLISTWLIGGALASLSAF